MSTLMLIGAGISAAGQVQQGRIAKAQGEFAEKIGERNQQALSRQAKAEREAASVEEGRLSRKEKFVKASQRAASAKSGFSLAGASMNVLSDTAKQFALDRNLLLRRGFIRGQELEDQGRIQKAQGKFAKSSGKSAFGASILGAVGTGTMGYANWKYGT